MSIRNLDRLLTPRSVAVFGASSRAGSVGATVWRNLRGGAFAGPIFGVNPNHPQVDGVPVFRSADDLPEVPDLAVICTPPATVPGIVGDLAARGTAAAIVMTAGLTRPQKQATLDAARPHLLRLLGPNCLGLMTPRLALNASFAHTDALAGEIAFVSQSGALVTAMLDWAKSRRIGFSHMVSLGERCDVDFGDLLDHLASDGHTRAILLYIESIEHPRKFMSAARAAARNKPVIVVKAGRAGKGMAAAASHTGAMAGSDIVFDAAIRRAGMLRVDTMQELFMAAQTLARFRRNASDVLTIMTNGGGGGVMAADAAARSGIELYEPDAALLAKLDGALPPTWSRGNPVDIIGDAPIERYTATLSALLDEPKSGAILFLHAPTAIVPSSEIARACVPIAGKATQRVMACWMGDACVAEARGLFEAAGIADYATPEEAVRAFSLLVTYRRNQEQLLEAPAASQLEAPDVTTARAVVATALQEGREWLDEVEAKAVAAAYGIPVARTLTVPASPDAAVAAARELQGPVVLKILSPQITHKSDVGGVALRLVGDDAVRDAARGMLARVRAAKPEAELTGFTVQPMIERPRAEELIVGASVDPVFGPVILFGQGGVSVEVVGDRAIALPPLNRALAAELVSRTRVSKLLAGYRDRPAAQIGAVHDVLIAVSQMLADIPELTELDLNPLLADADGVIALDARVRVATAATRGSERFAIRPYPQQLAETVPWNGGTLTLRPIRPEDEAQHLHFLQQLDPEDIRMRIFHSRRELPRSELARLTQIDYAREMAFIAERTRADGTRETLGTVRAVSDPDNVDAEFAVIVRSDLKGQGLGRMLMDKVIRYARANGTTRLVGVILRENRAMRNLAESVGFSADRTKSGDPDLEYVVMVLR